ncbi:MAG: SRPBCC domain-containing protein [Brachymonas sp.]|nr:SRPBCC domain-containing protein [Brachymonas sp.]
MTNAQQRDMRLPFLQRYPILWGVAAGLVLRFVFFGEPGSTWSAMAGAFIFNSPLLVGAVTVYMAEKIKRRSWSYYFWAPFVANCLFVLGTLLIMIEGLICAVIIIPMYALIGSFGGLAMGLVCRLTNWPKQTLYALAALPITLGFAGDLIPTPDEFSRVESSIVISAPPAVVWQQITQAKDISPEDFKSSWAARIGVPMPLTGVTSYQPGQSPTGYVRQASWQKKVHFEGLVTDWQPNQYVRWTYRFSPDSFPKQALDDHVMIGGHYFDLLDTSFKLTPTTNDIASGSTRLTVSAHYRVSTQFNFYAERVAQLLLGNMLDTATDFFKHRSERAARSSQPQLP